MTGTIKKKTDRGFGFISLEGKDQDLFFHSSELNGVTFDEIQEGEVVEFEVKDGDNGRQSAVNVRRASGGQAEVAEEAQPTEEAGTADEAPEEKPSE